MATTPPAAHCSGGSGRERRACCLDRHRFSDEEHTGEHVESVAATRRVDERCDLAGGQVGEDVGTQPLRHRSQRVAGAVERLAGAANVVGPGEEAHGAIVTHPPSSISSAVRR